MRSSLSHKDALDRIAANRAGIACALVNTKIILKISPPIDPIDAGSLALDAF